MLGSELVFDPSRSPLEKAYIRVFGVPINGLRNRARRVLPEITDHHKEILDAGCGQGVMTFEMARRLPNSTVTGIDIEEDLLDRNRRIAETVNLPNCHFEYDNITEMEIRDRFDLVVTVDNLEHIEDDQDALNRLYAALVPSGEILIHVPGYYRRWLVFGWEVNFDVDGHFRPGYTKEQIVEKVEKAGFELIESYYTYGWLETITNNISYWITGARMKNKPLYALVFPLLLFISYFGRNSRPQKGAGVLVRAKKPEVAS